MINTLRVFVLVIVYLVSTSHQLKAQSILEAIRISEESEITVDGSLSEDVWQRAEIATGFTQSAPFDGAPATEKTEVQVVYTDKYLFVGAMAYDSNPDSIMATLFRRDGDESSDWLYVNIDSYNDDLTAFTFAINPLGVQKDIMYFDDSQEDILWDAVWEAKTKILENGWSAEFKIPLSQLRFTSNNEIQNWGINFQRRIARRAEISFWSRTPREEFGVVSRFGELRGVENLDRPLRLEISPYVSSEFKRDDVGSSVNPFYEQNDYLMKVGGDIKYGLSSDFTLTATLNPDFGQVEADPSTINLTEFELFFEERRPFFLEGSDIFNFGSTTSQNSFRSHTNFYSRRIGRTPFAVSEGLHTINNNGETIQLDFTESHPLTTIAGAAKVSGKTQNGLSVGLLNSYTLEESTKYFDTSTSLEGSIPIEPATNYLVGRVRKDLMRTDAQIGAYFSSVNRNLGSSYLADYLHESAYQFGVDGVYYWKDRSWGASGVFSVSNVNGSVNAINRTQQTSARFFNRVDSDELSIDPNATSLTGYFGEFSIGKYSGSGLRYSLTYSEMSPEYEVNDLGFLERADYRAPHYYLEYLNVDSDLFQFYLLWSDISHAWNFDGDMIYNFYTIAGYFQLNNLWTVLTYFSTSGRFYNDRIARGGPTMLRPKDWNSYIDITTDASKNVYGNFSTSYRRDSSGEYQITLDAGINFRPSSNALIRIAPGYIHSKDNDQYQGFADLTGDGIPDYVFSNIDLDVIFAEFRANLTFTPRLSLQTFLRPYHYTADFTNYKTFSEAKTFNFNPIDPADNATFDSTNDQEFSSLQGNAVLRWEYRPGSTLFFVWQQERNFFDFGNANFKPYGALIDTFTNDPINIFLVKVNYWFGS